MPAATDHPDPFMAIPFRPLSEAFWLGRMPPLGKAWEDDLWRQIETWKAEQGERATQGQLGRIE